MPVETFAYLNSLNASNPPGSDGLAQGDDHIRGIKSTLLSTFTGLTGATNVTQTTLNALEDQSFQMLVPVGAICDFVHGVPVGWVECNGQAVSRTGFARLFALYSTAFGAGDGSTTFNLPDMRDRYRRQRSATYAANATIAAQVGTHGHTATGATTLSIASDGSHAHGGSTSGNNVGHTHAGTTNDDSPDHTHLVNDPGHAHNYGNRNSDANFGTATFGAPGSGGTASTTSATTGISLQGASARHQHTFTSGGESTGHIHTLTSDGAHSHAGSTATTTVTVANSTTQENMPNTFVVITCVKY